jgi:hypothetical protein
MGEGRGEMDFADLNFLHTECCDANIQQKYLIIAILRAHQKY